MAAKDLTGIDTIFFDVYSNRTGSNLKFGLKNGTVSSPVSQWKMNDNAATTVVIDSVGSNAGTSAQNTDQLDSTGKINGALSFNGSTDYISCGNTGLPTGSSARTICMWVNPDAITVANAALFSYGTVAAYEAIGWNFAASTQKLQVGRYGGNASANSSTDVPLGEWSHVAFTYDSGNIVYYLNGVADGTATIADVNTGSTYCEIGRCWNSAAQQHDGLMDDVRIYDFALSASDISAVYNSGSGTEDENPVVISTETTPNITSASTWQTVTWDISAVADVDKDAIDTFIITAVDADAANTFYVDNIYAGTADSDIFQMVN